MMVQAEEDVYAQIWASDFTRRPEYRPVVIMNYVSLAGLEGYLSYEDHSVGRAGTGHVSLYNGNLIFEHQDNVPSGGRMAVAVSHIYNSCDKELDPFHAGYGWKTNYDQALYMETVEGVTYYVWMDEDGTRHHFAEQEGKWKDLILSGTGAPGSVWFSAVQLEEGVVAGRPNLLDNGDFTYGMTGWGKPSTCTEEGTVIEVTADGVVSPAWLARNMLQVTGGGHDSVRRIYQAVQIAGSKGDVYVAGGWSRAYSIPRGDRDDRYRLLVAFYDGTTWKDGASVKWSEEWSGWHLAAAPISAPCAYTKIRVSVDYYDNYNAAWFGGLFLHKERFGVSYA